MKFSIPRCLDHARGAGQVQEGLRLRPEEPAGPEPRGQDVPPRGGLEQEGRGEDHPRLQPQGRGDEARDQPEEHRKVSVI